MNMNGPDAIAHNGFDESLASIWMSTMGQSLYITIWLPGSRYRGGHPRQVKPGHCETTTTKKNMTDVQAKLVKTVLECTE